MEDAIPPDPSRLTALAEQLDRLMAAPTEKPTLVYLDVMGIGWPIHLPSTRSRGRLRLRPPEPARMVGPGA